MFEHEPSRKTFGSPSQVTMKQSHVQNFYETDKSLAPQSTVKSMKASKKIKLSKEHVTQQF